MSGLASPITWRRNQMKTFFALMALCEGHKGQWRGVLMFSFICAWTNVEHTAIWDTIALIITSLQWLATRLFVQQFLEVDIKENFTALHYWPFVRETQWRPANSPPKEPLMWKSFPCYGVFIIISPLNSKIISSKFACLVLFVLAWNAVCVPLE